MYATSLSKLKSISKQHSMTHHNMMIICYEWSHLVWIEKIEMNIRLILTEFIFSDCSADVNSRLRVLTDIVYQLISSKITLSLLNYLSYTHWHASIQISKLRLNEYFLSLIVNEGSHLEIGLSFCVKRDPSFICKVSLQFISGGSISPWSTLSWHTSINWSQFTLFVCKYFLIIKFNG